MAAGRWLLEIKEASAGARGWLLVPTGTYEVQQLPNGKLQLLNAQHVFEFELYELGLALFGANIAIHEVH